MRQEVCDGSTPEDTARKKDFTKFAPVAIREIPMAKIF